ncbi:MAG: hypothetical protein A2048_07270 [Deltaproteobacteria bacterium GWA2_45_12]|nr:MAG: hypothetical protein A2048_07270 [Deltaproteobacteria bacterium GWA2_45_12]
MLTTISATLMIIGLAAEFLGVFRNAYLGIFIFLVLPVGMIAGLLIMPVAAYLRRRHWEKHGVEKEHLQINLSNHRHRLFVIGFIVLTSINFVILGMISYEGYHYTESNQFCGAICHKVMEPEYTVYQRSPHARVDCVNCHIGSGADWYVRAKISGLRQVAAVMLGTYNKPIHTPIEHLRFSRETCEQCHWSEKFAGKKTKTFIHFTNENQLEPDKTNIALHIGGRNPRTEAFEGIHWHVSRDIQVSFLAADEKRTSIPRVRVKKEDGSINEYSNGEEVPADKENKWRVMECVDCHNRPTHIYKSAEEAVDFGLLSKKINPEIIGLREDGLKALKKGYASREEARSELGQYLMGLQTERNQEQANLFSKDIQVAGDYLLEQYMGNVWPNMNIDWGTYKSHLGHEYELEGYGCFRCHDDEHETKKGKVISQDCDFCHDDPP